MTTTDPFARSAETPQWRAIFEAAHYLTRSTLMKHRVVYDADLPGWRIIIMAASLNEGYESHSAVARQIAADTFASEVEGLTAHEAWLAEQRGLNLRSVREEWIESTKQYTRDMLSRHETPLDEEELHAKIVRMADLMGIT